ncbi:LAFA_0E12838g1_1 [Lachancea sp. 'fantastica']|nr:LAFA_0E12838g1_1 [Lachancea sp. 'fantastica']
MKIAIINADFAQENLAKYGDFADMAVTMLEQTRDFGDEAEYVTYNAHKDQFPSIDQLRSYDGIYITGSKFDAFDTSIGWIIRLRDMLSTILTTDGFPPVAGVCFGHQIVAASLGCRVDRNVKGFEGGIVSVQLTPEAKRLGLLQKPGENPVDSIQMADVHNDIVYDMPTGYTNIGSSSKCSIQGLYKKSKVFTLQSHPEFVTDVVVSILHSKRTQKLLEEAQVKKMEQDSLMSVNDGYFAATFIWKLYKLEI